MNKYLVFVLERRIPSGHPIQGELVQQCFELVKEFEIEFDDWVMEKQLEMKVYNFAREYSKDHGVRTVVVKGAVFGD